jgi:hypothetical protein
MAKAIRARCAGKGTGANGDGDHAPCVLSSLSEGS